METSKFAILLTACVDPQGMSFTQITDVNIRSKQYIDTITFFLKETNLPIVVCENTNWSIPIQFNQYIKKNRLEYITFNGNNFNKERGKGYGEALIILHAIKHSTILPNCKYLIKITGRVIIPNILQLTSSPLYLFNNLIRCNFAEGNNAESVIFIAPPLLLEDILKKHLEEITEYPRGFWFEKIFYKAIVNDNTAHLIPFTVAPIINGISATHNKKYYTKSSIDNMTDNLYYWLNYIQIQKQNSSPSKHLYYQIKLFSINSIYRIILVVKRILKTVR